MLDDDLPALLHQHVQYNLLGDPLAQPWSDLTKDQREVFEVLADLVDELKRQAVADSLDGL